MKHTNIAVEMLKRRLAIDPQGIYTEATKVRISQRIAPRIRRKFDIADHTK